MTGFATIRRQRTYEVGPLIILRFSVIYIAPACPFSFLRILDLGPYRLLIVVFLMDFALGHLLVQRIHRPGVSANVPIFQLISGCFGQGPHTRPRTYSYCILIVAFSFFVYVNYLAETSFVISILTTPQKKMSITNLDMVRVSQFPLFVSEMECRLFPTMLRSVRWAEIST